MSDAPERIWAVTEPNDISADILGEVYAQQIPDGMNGTPVEYVRADRIEQLAAINEALIAERDEAWKRAAHSEKMWGEAEVKLTEVEKDAKRADAIWSDNYEALKAKLSKAVGALGDISNGEPEWPDDPQKELDWCRNRATTTLAELAGGKDG